MDDQRFDALTRRLGQGGSRRTLLKSLIGLGGVAATGAVLHDANAARRGYPGPPTLGPLSTQTPQPTGIPTQTAQPTNVPTQTPLPTNTPNSCGSSGVCCSSSQDCQVIPTYCESTAQYPLLWRYHLCSYTTSGTGFCTLTAHVCDNARGSCEIDICGDATDCAVAPVQPGQIGKDGRVCCTDHSHCADLPRYCDGGDWHYYICSGGGCVQSLNHCGAGQCQEPIGCQAISSG